MSLNQQIIREVLNREMQPGIWYEVKDLINLFSKVYANFGQIDIDPLPSEPNRPRWHRLVTNSVRMSPGRNDYPTDNSWVELRTRKPKRNFEYSLALEDPVEAEIVRSFRDDDGSGYIYAITNDAFINWVKIGKTIDFAQRLAAYQTYSPYQDFKELDKIRVNDRHTAEGYAHRLAADRTKVDPSGEWFFISDDDVGEILTTVESLK